MTTPKKMTENSIQKWNTAS